MSLDNSLIFTAGSEKPKCSTYTVLLKDKDGNPVEGAVAEFTAQYQGAEPEAKGKFNSEAPTSDAEGKVSGIFCADKDYFKVVLVVKVVNLTKNPAEITATKKGTYSFSYMGSSQDEAVDTKETLKAEYKDPNTKQKKVIGVLFGGRIPAESLYANRFSDKIDGIIDQLRCRK